MSVSQKASKWLAFKFFVALKLVLLLYKLLDSGAAKTLMAGHFDLGLEIHTGTVPFWKPQTFD